MFWQGRQTVCAELVVYVLPTLYVVVFYDFNQDRDPEDPESFRKLFNFLNSFEINAAYDRAPQRGR